MCYLCDIEDFIHYIKYGFGLPASAERLPLKAGIPLYLTGNYSLFHGQVAGRTFIWAKVQDESVVTPDRLQEQKRQLEHYVHAPVVFVFQQLDSWQRKRLIEKQVGFVQTNKQLYIPELVLQLNDIRSGVKPQPDRPEHVSFSTQVAILYHLQREPLDQLSALEIASRLGYSAMTVTRIIRELQQWDWVIVHPGKERTFLFKQKGERLWEKVLPWLRNPIQQIWFSEVPFGFMNRTKAGETALSIYTMLAESREMYQAVSKEDFKSLKTLQQLPELNTRQGHFCLQVWQYEPRMLSEPGSQVVDRLSLYLTLKDEGNERLQEALQELLKQMKW